MPTHPLRAAVEARDIEALIETLSPDVVLHSPLISEAFRGREEVGFLFRLLADVYLFRDDFEYTAELADGDTVVLAFRGSLRGQEVEGVDLMRLGADGKVEDVTVFLRPLPGTTAVAKYLAPRLGGRGNRAKAVLAHAGTGPLVGMSKMFDAIGSRDVRARQQRPPPSPARR